MKSQVQAEVKEFEALPEWEAPELKCGAVTQETLSSANVGVDGGGSS